MEEYGGLIVILLFMVVPIFLTRLRKVPPNTTIIIDRNTHFHKKKKHGYYWFNPATDVITTMISTNEITEKYSNIFKTHDDNYYEFIFSFSYKALDINMVLSSLQDSRRSIYDIVNCAVETVVASLGFLDLPQKDNLNATIFRQLESMLEPFYIDATNFRLMSYRKVEPLYGRAHKFNKHVSSSDNPVGGSSSDSIIYSNHPDGDDPFRSL